jgi:hypothetical protein
VYDVIAAASSTSPRGAERNQDRVGVLRIDGNEESDGVAVVICDGVGAYPESGTVASEVLAFTEEHIRHAGISKGVWTLDTALAAMNVATADGATTLIAVGADQSGLVSHAFVGNGSLFEVAPGDTSSSTNARLRWIDLALPQMSWGPGRPALSSFIPAQDSEFDVAKGYRMMRRVQPRLYLACSDGIASDEKRIHAKSPQGKFWSSVPAELVTVIGAIEDEWLALLEDTHDDGQERLQKMVEASLAELLDSAVCLNDDASVACVLMCPDGRPKEKVRD